MRAILGFSFTLVGWYLLFSQAGDKIITSIGGFLLCIGSVLIWSL